MLLGFLPAEGSRIGRRRSCPVTKASPTPWVTPPKVGPSELAQAEEGGLASIYTCQCGCPGRRRDLESRGSRQPTWCCRGPTADGCEPAEPPGEEVLRSCTGIWTAHQSTLHSPWAFPVFPEALVGACLHSSQGPHHGARSHVPAECSQLGRSAVLSQDPAHEVSVPGHWQGSHGQG